MLKWHKRLTTNVVNCGKDWRGIKKCAAQNGRHNTGRGVNPCGARDDTIRVRMCDMGAVIRRMTDIYATWARLCTSAACGVPSHKSYVIRQILRNRKNNLTINCKDNLLWIFNELIFNEIKIFEKVDF